MSMTNQGEVEQAEGTEKERVEGGLECDCFFHIEDIRSSSLQGQ